ncbi:type II toxin-antitoxin system RelE/ParE family toxin [Legionella dresdenensis]|uniref:Type II toxin-antitoxin system RelE/ParE family toxin n=1 Tax=Legionella dresdenensis TaxID=450200 RepID=A0ABV8CBQ1_9GAMM
MKHYKIKKFTREAKKELVNDALLIDTINDFLNLDTQNQNQYSLGSGLYKLRLATKEGRGKSGGSRTILAYKANNKIIWLHLFSKNEKGNVTASELKKLKLLSTILLNLSETDIQSMINMGELLEVDKNV